MLRQNYGPEESRVQQSSNSTEKSEADDFLSVFNFSRHVNGLEATPDACPNADWFQQGLGYALPTTPRLIFDWLAAALPRTQHFAVHGFDGPIIDALSHQRLPATNFFSSYRTATPTPIATRLLRTKTNPRLLRYTYMIAYSCFNSDAEF